MAQICVLVVDPNPSTPRKVEEALGHTGASVMSARDAVEAEAAMRGRSIGLLLSAVTLPRGNGYDLTKVVRARFPGVAAYLLAGGFEVYSNDRARDAGVSGRIARPFTVESLRAMLEPVLLPMLDAPAAGSQGPADDGDTEPGIESRAVTEARPGAPWRPPTSDERIATLLPRDYQQLPLVRVDPAVVGPAMERAILEVLPEVVEIVLRRTLQSSSAFRDLVEVAVDEAVRAQLPAIAQRVVRERLVEMEARGPDDQ